MTTVPKDLEKLGKGELIVLVRTLETERETIVSDLKGVRVRLESASAILHSIIELWRRNGS